jgi:hypothetical protein
MGTEWGGYHLHLLFKSLLYLLSVLLSWVTLNSHRCLRKRTSVVRRSYFVCPISPFLFGCRYFDDVPSRYDVAKGPISFGAAHLRFCSAWFVTKLLCVFI